MRCFALVLALLTVIGPGRAHASGQSGSSSGSGSDSASSKDSNSSNGSNDSSNSSKDSSDDSHASSKDSNDSTQNSPQNSSDYTTRHSSDWTTRSRDGHIFSVAMLVVSVGATVVGVMVAKGSHQPNQQAASTLAETMRRQHPLLTHDLATARGPVLDAWAHDLRLTPAERRRLVQALEGSAEQGELLDALDGKIDEARARRFGAAFLLLTRRAVGETRARAIVERAVGAVGTG